MNVIVFPSDLGGCGWYRLIQPFSIISKTHEVKWAIAYNVMGIYTMLDVKFDLLVSQRQYEAIQERVLNQMSIPYAIDTDDAIWYKNPHSPVTFKESQLAIHDRILKKAQVLVASTPYLKEELEKRIGKEVNYLPNLVSRRFFVEPVIRQRQKLKVLYAGSITHYGDLKPFIPMIRKLAMSDKYEFVFVGYVPEELRNYVTFYEGTPYTHIYLPYLAKLECDVGLAPLASNNFNRAKSHLKMLEYSAIGLPVLASNIEPYKENPNPSLGFDLEEKLDLLSDPQIRKDWAIRNYEYAQKYILEDWEERILRAYRL
ncbi:MAG: hypothetical protein QXV17_10285 [Candidatus Micrarchaeaceae archaeon]